MSDLWTVARNASGRPTLQHAIDPREPDVLVCDPNFIIVGWSRSYSAVPIASIACKKCLRATGVIANTVTLRQTHLRAV